MPSKILGIPDGFPKETPSPWDIEKKKKIDKEQEEEERRRDEDRPRLPIPGSPEDPDKDPEKTPDENPDGERKIIHIDL